MNLIQFLNNLKLYLRNRVTAVMLDVYKIYITLYILWYCFEGKQVIAWNPKKT